MFTRLFLASLSLCALDAQERARPDSSLAVANRILASKTATLNQLIEVDAYIQTHSLRITGLLRFRWFQILDRIAQHPEFTAAGTSDKYRAWAVRTKVLNYFEPGAEWYVPQAQYWNLFSANATAAWAEELAWFATTRTIQSDECYAECVLFRILDRPAQYWMRFPAGLHIADALANAASLAGLAEKAACERTNPDLFKMTFVSSGTVNQVRSSLSGINDPAQRPLMRTLDTIEMKCRY